MNRYSEVRSSVDNIEEALKQLNYALKCCKDKRNFNVTPQHINIAIQNIIGAQHFCKTELDIINKKTSAEKEYFDKNPAYELLQKLAITLAKYPSETDELINDIENRKDLVNSKFTILSELACTLGKITEAVSHTDDKLNLDILMVADSKLRCVIETINNCSGDTLENDIAICDTAKIISEDIIDAGSNSSLEELIRLVPKDMLKEFINKNKS